MIWPIFWITIVAYAAWLYYHEAHLLKRRADAIMEQSRCKIRLRFHLHSVILRDRTERDVADYLARAETQYAASCASAYAQYTSRLTQ